MSTQIDQRVVQMRFDNEQFEKGSKQTLSTLEKLQEKLQFRGAEKGLENLSNASRKVDFAEMSGALDTLQVKFNALDVAAMTVLTRITNKVISTGEALVKSLSLDQVMSGWTKYAEKTGNVQTIMNATGKSIDQVNSYLDELMWYSDETSFSFAEMTSAISQATAAGGDLKKMVPMVMGIANATADAGKSGYAFQSTIRNLMQSYSAGHLQLMDWKSLQLMGTATKTLKQELIDTAVELGTIKEGEVTVSNFEDTLQKKWATSAVMEKTFGKYAQMMTEAYQLTQQNKGMTTSEALEQLAGKYGEIAERSALAAQQAKSFNEAIDSTKDAVSSKWMEVFETIFGGYDEAVDTWTELANRLYDIFVPPIQELEDRLNGALDSGMVQLQKLFGNDSDIYAAALEKTALATGAVTQQAIDDAGSFTKALEQGGVSAETLHGAVKKVVKDADSLLALSDADLTAKGYTREQLQAIRDNFAGINEKIEAGVIDLGAYAQKMSEVSGRQRLMQSLWNIWDAIAKVLDPIAEAFHEIFAPANSKEIHSFIEGFQQMTEKLTISDESAEKIKMTFRGLFSVVKAGTDLLSGIAKIAGQLVKPLAPLGEGILDIASALGECLTGMVETAEKSSALQLLLDGIQWTVSGVSTVLNELAGVLSRVASNTTIVFDPLKQLGEWIANLIDFAGPGIAAFGQMAAEGLKNFWTSAQEALGNADPEAFGRWISTGLTAGVLAGLKGLLDAAKEVVKSGSGIVSGVKEAIESLGEAVDAWKSTKKAETLLTIAKSVAVLAASLTVLSMIQPDRLAGGIGALMAVMGELIGAFVVLDKFAGKAKGGKLALLAGSMVAMSTSVLILSGAVAKLASVPSGKLLSSVTALGAVMAELTAVSFAMTKIGGGSRKEPSV